MKLLARYNRVNIITTILIMLVTSFAYYQAISWILTRQNDKALKDEEIGIMEYVSSNHELPEIIESKYQQIIFKKARPNSVIRRLIDTPYFKKWGQDNPKRIRYHKLGEYESGRALITSVTLGSKDNYYQVTITQSKAETEDLIRIIFAITIGVILLLLIVLFATNRLILNQLWQPFYSIMDELEAFDIADGHELTRLDTGIDEFSYLNKVVTDMTTKAKNDYRLLKTFTENASHELLTPIAIINSRLDNLIQTANFSEQQSKLLNDLYRGVSRLNRLNQSLLLLVKIENNLLNEQGLVDLRELLEEIIIQTEDICLDKQLEVIYTLDPKQIVASLYVIEILMNNLVINAIRHNLTGGRIIISLTEERLIIQNTGDGTPLPVEQIFTRFYKSSGSEGNGLGLTIARQICENLRFSLNYQFLPPYHTFTITFFK